MTETVPTPQATVPLHPTPPDQEPPMKTFLIVWAGQLVSIVGTSLTWFGLSVWVYLESESVTQLSMMILAATLPRVLLSPVAGVFVDRWNRRWTMIVSDAASGLATAVIAVAFLFDFVSLPLLLVIGALSAAFEAFHWPAYQAATSLLVPKERYSQAAGMVQLAEAAGQLLAPFLGALMIAAGGVGLLIAIDAATFLLAITTLGFVRFPKPPPSEIGGKAAGTIWQETMFGFRYVYERHSLLALLVLFAGINLVLGFLSPAFIAFILAIGTTTTMGSIMSLGATGMIVGSIVASAWKVTSGRVVKLLWAVALLGVALILAGSSTAIPVIVAALWVGMLVLPIGNAMSQSLWMAKVELDIQGRVFAARSAIAQIGQPIALLLAGPIIDGLFVRLMAGDSPTAGVLEAIVGSGEHAPYAAFLLIIGFGTIVLAFVGYLYRPLRDVESILPDVLPDAAAAPHSERQGEVG